MVQKELKSHELSFFPTPENIGKPLKLNPILINSPVEIIDQLMIILRNEEIKFIDLDHLPQKTHYTLVVEENDEVHLV